MMMTKKHNFIYLHCTQNEGTNTITIGKVYHYINEVKTPTNIYFEILNDIGEKRLYPSEYFKELDMDKYDIIEHPEGGDLAIPKTHFNEPIKNKKEFKFIIGKADKCESELNQYSKDYIVEVISLKGDYQNMIILVTLESK